MPLQMDTAARLFDSGKSFYMCACRQDDYAPNYFLPTKQNWLDVIRASSAIPGFQQGALHQNSVGDFGAVEKLLGLRQHGQTVMHGMSCRHTRKTIAQTTNHPTTSNNSIHHIAK